MRRVRVLAVAALAAALAAPASADLYTWTDASGRVNISNVEPPQDVHARRIAQAPAERKQNDAARAAAQASEVAALKARVAELESEVERAQPQAGAAPAPYPVAAPATSRVVVVTPPAAPPIAYAPPPDVAPCDPLVFGCPAFGYPVSVVVIKQPRFHRRDGVRGARFHAARPPQFVPVRPPQFVPARPMPASRHR